MSKARQFLESIGICEIEDGLTMRNLKDRVISYWEQTALKIKLNENPEFIEMLAENGVTKIQESDSIGYIEDYKGQGPRWVGWSHRAMVPFGIGDMLFNKEEYERMNNENLPFTKGGSKLILNMEQAKEAARNFVEYIS